MLGETKYEEIMLLSPHSDDKVDRVKFIIETNINIYMELKFVVI